MAKCAVEDLRIYSCFSTIPVKVTRRGSRNKAVFTTDASFDSSMALTMLQQQLEMSGMPVCVVYCNGIYDDEFEVTPIDFITYVNSADLSYERNTLIVVPNVHGDMCDVVYARIICEDTENIDMTLNILNSNLLREFIIVRCYDNECVYNTIKTALTNLLEEMKVISIIFRQLAYGLRNQIIRREESEENNHSDLSEYITFFRKLNGDYSNFTMLQGDSNDDNDNEFDTIVLGPRMVTRKGMMDKVCRVRESTDTALMEAFDACAIYEP